MARIVMVLLGLALLTAGLWACLVWWDAVRMVLLACLALGVTLFGLFLLIFGISEIVGARIVKHPSSDQ